MPPDQGRKAASDTTAATIHGAQRDRARMLRAVAAIVCLVAFAALTAAAAYGPVADADRALHEVIADDQAPPSDVAMALVSHLGGGHRLTLLAALLVAGLLIVHRQRAAIFVAAGFLVAELSSPLLKALIARPRPDLDDRALFQLPGWLNEAWIALVVLLVIAAWPTRWRRAALFVGALVAVAAALDVVTTQWMAATNLHESFPSGHALRSGALLSSLAIVFWESRWRLPIVIGGAALVVAVGLSRIYLGLHYPSDVLGGWLVGVGSVLIVSALPMLDPLPSGGQSQRPGDEARSPSFGAPLAETQPGVVAD